MNNRIRSYDFNSTYHTFSKAMGIDLMLANLFSSLHFHYVMNNHVSFHMTSIGQIGLSIRPHQDVQMLSITIKGLKLIETRHISFINLTSHFINLTSHIMSLKSCSNIL
jgi:hypothetical protein